MPLAYTETKAPSCLTLTLKPNDDGISILYVTGSRYGGAWVLNAILDPSDPEPDILGTIKTAQDERPSMAADTAYVWINHLCQQSGLKIVKFDDLNDQYPPDTRPFFSTTRFVIVNKDWQ